MSFLKKPFKKLKGFSGSEKDSVSSSTPSKEEGPSNGATNGSAKEKRHSTMPPEIDSRRQSQEILQQERVRRSMDKERTKAEAKKRATLARIESETFLKEGPPNLTKLYRPYSMNMSKNWNHEHRSLFKEIDFASKLVTASSGHWAWAPLTRE
jgi:hypothetical protein